MSKARQKGTSFENHVLALIREVWPEALRAAQEGINDYGDFANVDGWHIEARNRTTWALPAWIRGVYDKIDRKHGAGARLTRNHPWMVVFKADKRGILHEDYVTVPLWVMVEALRRLKRDQLDTTIPY